MEVKTIFKKAVRIEAIIKRDQIDRNDRAYRSRRIVQKLNALDLIQNALNIMCYVSFGSEVETHGLISDWILQGKKLSVPCVSNAPEGAGGAKKKCIVAVGIHSLDELVPRTYGILEPQLDNSRIIAPQELDVVIVPGTVFDINKNRMGYGAGFYDRYLKGISPNCQKIGICFDSLLLESIPHDRQDVPMDMIVTENRMISGF